MKRISFGNARAISEELERQKGPTLTIQQIIRYMQPTNSKELNIFSYTNNNVTFIAKVDKKETPEVRVIKW